MYLTFKTIPLLHHPLILATGALITGIFLFTLYNSGNYWSVIFLFFCIGLLIAGHYVLSLQLSLIAIFMTFFIIGFCRTYFYYAMYDSFSQSITHKKINIRGSIIDIDQIDHPFFYE